MADSKLLPCAGAAAPLTALINADASGVALPSVPAPIAEMVDTLFIEVPPKFYSARLKQCVVSSVVTSDRHRLLWNKICRAMLGARMQHDTMPSILQNVIGLK